MQRNDKDAAVQKYLNDVYGHIKDSLHPCTVCLHAEGESVTIIFTHERSKTMFLHNYPHLKKDQEDTSTANAHSVTLSEAEYLELFHHLEESVSGSITHEIPLSKISGVTSVEVRDNLNRELFCKKVYSLQIQKNDTHLLDTFIQNILILNFIPHELYMHSQRNHHYLYIAKEQYDAFVKKVEQSVMQVIKASDTNTNNIFNPSPIYSITFTDHPNEKNFCRLYMHAEMSKNTWKGLAYGIGSKEFQEVSEIAPFLLTKVTSLNKAHNNPSALEIPPAGVSGPASGESGESNNAPEPGESKGESQEESKEVSKGWNEDEPNEKLRGLFKSWQ